MKKYTIHIILSILISVCVSGLHAAIPLPNIPTTQFLITNYGATTTSMNNATAINAAITAANTAGGGTVVLPTGTFLSGPITMKSNVNLYLAAGDTLRILPYGSGNGIDANTYPNNGSADQYTPFIYGKSLSNVEVSGSGVIDGQGSAWWTAYNNSTALQASMKRPCLIRIVASNTVWITGITLINSPGVHLTLGQSSSMGSNGTISNVTVKAPSTSPNTDALDTWYWNNIYIHDCNFSEGDDNIAMDSYSTNITIKHCTFGSGHGLSVGSYVAGVNNVFADSCTFNSTTNGIRLKTNNTRGGQDSTFVYSNITMTNVTNPFYITSWYDKEPYPASSQVAGTITSTTPLWKNITFKNFTVTGSANAGIIYGLPELYVQNVTFDNVKISAKIGMIANYVKNLKFINSSAIAVTTSGKHALISDTGTGTTPYAATVSGINLTSGAAVQTVIDEVIADENLKCYPNPLQGDDLTVKSDNGISKVTIYSLTGVRIKELNGNGLVQLPVNLSDIGAGCYVINVIFSNNTTSSRKLIKE